MKKTLGGDRLGSGSKISVNLHNYGRSTHNLSRAWRSSMSPGTLVPFLVEVGLNGDTFDIDLTTLIRTLPTQGPLYGSFKLQADVFTAPIRLYNRQLHNNKLGIGKNMNKVIFPQMKIATNKDAKSYNEPNSQQVNQSSLLAYLGTRGLGIHPTGAAFTRKINAMPLLVYWDIFKNYYANKQENNAYYITSDFDVIPPSISSIWNGNKMVTIQAPFDVSGGDNITIYGSNLASKDTYILYTSGGSQYSLEKLADPNGEPGWVPFLFFTENTNSKISFTIRPSAGKTNIKIQTSSAPDNIAITNTRLQSFPLSSIDDMREAILSHDNETPLFINGTLPSPNPYEGVYKTIDTTTGDETVSVTTGPMAGLAVKTYMSDRFNNWLSTEWIDGANGIAAITAVDTSSGSFTMDTLNLAKKVYDMLNRIAVSGGTYLDWQEAVYGEASRRSAETPIYWGSLSTEIMFNEVISTAETAFQDSITPLGTLAGRGSGHKNGQTIRVKIEEPSYVMGIVSITPRIDYSQGNKWFTRLETMDDLHKPALDGIGFQELITDEMAAWDTTVDINGNPTYRSAGKQPAWIHYMTSQNETYGTFANQNETMFMTLNRQYEKGQDGHISDLTTYIDPSKYNYAFADTNLDAQNFWIQIAMDITARRKMSAKAIPNL